jgi:predicted nucleic acid-binding protein
VKRSATFRFLTSWTKVARSGCAKSSNERILRQLRFGCGFFEHPVHHSSSAQQFAAAEKKSSACGFHSLAEVYAIMTALPIKPLVPPEQVLFFIEEIRGRLRLISLSAEEYSSTIQGVAAKGLSGGRVYDALVLACAAKCKAETIYTWNLKYYRTIAPHLASSIQSL